MYDSSPLSVPLFHAVAKPAQQFSHAMQRFPCL